MIKAYGDMDMPAGLSWNGFVIEGTVASIAEVKRCIHEAANVEVYWRKEVIRLREEVAFYQTELILSHKILGDKIC